MMKLATCLGVILLFTACGGDFSEDELQSVTIEELGFKLKLPKSYTYLGGNYLDAEGAICEEEDAMLIEYIHGDSLSGEYVSIKLGTYVYVDRQTLRGVRNMVNTQQEILAHQNGYQYKLTGSEYLEGVNANCGEINFKVWNDTDEQHHSMYLVSANRKTVVVHFVGPTKKSFDELVGQMQVS